VQLIFIIVVVAIVVGFLARGSLRPFERLTVHRWGMALAGLALQVVPLPHGVNRAEVTAVMVVSYALLIAFLWVNRQLPAVPIVLVGLSLNLLVIAPNAGMPVSASAVRAAGGTVADVPPAGTADKHHLMSNRDVLRPLGDVIPGPPPLGVVLSVGDLLLYAGVAIFVVMVMRGRFGENRRKPTRWMQGYRGKHLSPKRRPPNRALAAASHPSPPAGAARWGT
jgi:Family of unknown function (DUF5317)